MSKQTYIITMTDEKGKQWYWCEPFFVGTAMTNRNQARIYNLESSAEQMRERLCRMTKETKWQVQPA